MNIKLILPILPTLIPLFVMFHSDGFWYVFNCIMFILCCYFDYKLICLHMDDNDEK